MMVSISLVVIGALLIVKAGVEAHKSGSEGTLLLGLFALIIGVANFFAL